MCYKLVLHTMSTESRGFLSPPLSHNTCRNTWKPYCLCTSLIISLICSAILGTITIVCVVKPSVQDLVPASGTEGTLCFTCDEFGSGIESTETLYRLVKTHNNTFCCLKEDNKLMQTFIQVRLLFCVLLII